MAGKSKEAARSDTFFGLRPRTIPTFSRSESGSTAMEYGLIASIIALSLVVFLQSYADRLSTFFTTVAAGMH